MTVSGHASGHPLRSTAFGILLFVAMLATALAMGAALAHLLELPNKVALPSDQYFIVQQSYRGWNRLAYLLVLELATMVAVAVMARHEPAVLWPVVIAILCLLAAQALFWIFTYPANVATENWTMIPADWETLRRRWEYSHAAGAILQTFAMAALIFATIARARG